MTHIKKDSNRNTFMAHKTQRILFAKKIKVKQANYD